MSLVAFQLACAAVLGAAYLVTLRAAPDRRRRALEIASLAVAAWLGEHSCIELYRFYAYAEGWWLRIGHVPLLIPLIWPMVVLSAREVQATLWPLDAPHRRALAVGLVVVFDASLMEVVAVAAGYWRWAEGGYLGVPVMGIVGWGCFAFAASLWLDRPTTPRPLLALPLVAAIGAHGAILAIWWLALRWVLRGEIDRTLALAGFATLTALALALVVRARGQGRALTGSIVASRILATSVFVALLASLADRGALAVHFGLVALPYLAAVGWSALGARARPAAG